METDSSTITGGHGNSRCGGGYGRRHRSNCDRPGDDVAQAVVATVGDESVDDAVGKRCGSRAVVDDAVDKRCGPDAVAARPFILKPSACWAQQHLAGGLASFKSLVSKHCVVQRQFKSDPYVELTGSNPAEHLIGATLELVG